MQQLSIKAPKGAIRGAIYLDGSKSISNRALIVDALSGGKLELRCLSTSNDTRALQAALLEKGEVIDVGAAGTTMRFLTAYFASRSGSRKIMTGTERMKNRPIGVLVKALNELGASVNYMEKDACPPLSINGTVLEGGRVEMPASTSSQFISALLLIASSFEKGLEIVLIGKIVSRPYIQMTVDLLAATGISVSFIENKIKVAPSEIRTQDFLVEADWSAASYYYSLVALAEDAEIALYGLQEQSWQGDSEIQQIGNLLGVESVWQKDHLLLRKKEAFQATDFYYDFLNCPDLAQTIVVAAAGINVLGDFTGLETLAHKETDRILALQKELAKVGVEINALADACSIKTGGDFSKQLTVDTYEDHRMAMAFAPLSLKLGEMRMNEPLVVRKSYPNYWKDLERLGFEISWTE